MPRKTDPVQAQLRARVLDLHEKGVGRNDIARLTGVSTASVSRIVKSFGGSFDPRATEVAVANRVADLKELRARVALRLMAKSDALLDDLERAHTAFSFGGKDNTYAEHVLLRPPADAVKNLMGAIGIAVQRSNELEKFDSDRGVGDAVSVLDSLSAALKVAADVLDAPAQS